MLEDQPDRFLLHHQRPLLQRPLELWRFPVGCSERSVLIIRMENSNRSALQRALGDARSSPVENDIRGHIQEDMYLFKEVLKHSFLINSKSCSSASNIWKWKKPSGYNTGVNIYNSIVNNKVPLILNNERLATWYTCGPTVYDEAHIGHASSYMRFDIMKRILESFFNVDVVMLMGITDIDDKIISRARERNIDTSHLSRHYEQEFHHDMATLRILPPTIIARVTDHIPQIIHFCDTLLSKGMSYVGPSGTMYFDTEKLGTYGKLASVLSNDEEESSNIEKKCVKDFALWKAAKPGEPWWQAPWSKGRPGWHIECSAMASHIFGHRLDIHSGGIDLKFPHHENEESQCEAFHSTSQWTNYWIHAGHLHMENDETKMSKSLKNTVSIKDFLKENSVNDFRIFCLSKPYRHSIKYSDESINSAKGLVNKFKSFLDDCESYVDGHLTCSDINDSELLNCLNETRVTIKESLKDDFNTAKLLIALQDLIAIVNKNFEKKRNTILPFPRSTGVVAACSSYVSKILNLLGVHFPAKKALSISNDGHANTLPHVINSVVDFRQKVRLFALTTGPMAFAQSTIEPLKNDNEVVLEKSVLPELSNEPSLDKGTMEWTTNFTTKQIEKHQRKEREPLLIACDDIRDQLMTVGVQIKDRGKKSDWYLLENRSIEARKSNISQHDSFEPDYKPSQNKVKPSTK